MVIAAGFTLLLFIAMFAIASDASTPGVSSAVQIAVGAAVVLLGALATAATQRYRELSPWVRTTVVLASVQAAIAIAALVLWALSAQRIELMSYRYPLLTAMPAPTIAVGLGLLVVIAAALQRSRRAITPRWLQAVAAFALTYLLATALWLPIYAQFGDYQDRSWFVAVDAALRRAIALVLIPPAVVAAVAAAIVAVRPRWRRDAAEIGAGVLVMLLIAALASRASVGERERMLYGNLVPVLFAAGWFAMATIVALAVTHVRALGVAARDRRRPAPWCQHGSVVITAPSSTTVGQLVNRGWLAGMEATTRDFTLRTAHGDLPIPAGAAVIAPLPAWTAQAAAGAAVPVISEGDRVEVSGFVAAASGDAYRSSARPMLGTAGLVIFAARRADEPIARDLLLRVWRPCAALLIAVTIAGLPGLVALL